MNKVFTIAVAAMISLFLTTSVVAQGKQDRRHKGAEHSKKANAEKSNQCGVKACKCVCHKSAKVKAGPHRERRGDARRSRGGNRGRGAGTGRGSRRWDRGESRGRGTDRSERMEELLKRFRQHRAEAGGRA